MQSAILENFSILCFNKIDMPRLKEFDCTACGLKHPRPVGRNCVRSRDVASASSLPENANLSTVSASSKSSSSSTIKDDLAAQILASLGSFSEKLDGLDKRVQRNEEAMAAHFNKSDLSHSSPLTSTEVLGKSASLATRRVNVTHQRDSVVPSLDYVRSNEDLSAQASHRMAELKNLATGSRGKHSTAKSSTKLVSQRGAGEIRVERAVDWPNNFVLVGPDRVTTSYANLTWPQ